MKSCIETEDSAEDTLCASACLGTLPGVKHDNHYQSSQMKEAGVVALLVTDLALCFQPF